MRGVDISDERLPGCSGPLVGSEPVIDSGMPAPSSPTLKAGRLGAHHTGFVASCSPPHQRVLPHGNRGSPRAETEAAEGALPLRPAIGGCTFDATAAFRYLPNSAILPRPCSIARRQKDVVNYGAQRMAQRDMRLLNPGCFRARDHEGLIHSPRQQASGAAS